MENVGLYGRQASIGLHIPESVVITVVKSDIITTDNMQYICFLLEDLATVGVKTVVIAFSKNSVTIEESKNFKNIMENVVEKARSAGRIDFAVISINEAAIPVFLSSEVNANFAKSAQHMILDFDGDLLEVKLDKKWKSTNVTPIYIDVNKAVVAKTRSVQKIPSGILKQLDQSQWGLKLDRVDVIEYLNNMTRLVAVNIISKPSMYADNFAVNVADFMDTIVARVYTDLGVKTRVKKD